MKKLTMLFAFSAFVCISAVVFAQEPREDSRTQQNDQTRTREDSRTQQNDQTQPRDRQEAPADRQDGARQGNENNRQPAARQDQGRPDQQNNADRRENTTPGRENAGRPAQEQRGDHEQAARPQGQDQRGREQARGNRIPDDRYRSNFGREHPFVINRPVMEAGRPRFEYGGYWFELASPWPGDWAYSDDVYVEDVDGNYYLCNMRHPGVRIPVVVVGM